jgi:hypothetical protein
MSTMTTTQIPTPRTAVRAWATKRRSPTPWLQLGAIAGPVFLAASLLQATRRPGFDLTHNAASLLSLGNLGWIQDLNFAVAGLLSFAGAIGLRRALGATSGGTWLPRLFGVVGVGLGAASIFHPDPSGGFPPGTPVGASATSNWHGMLHMVCGSMAFLSLLVACFVFARRLTRTNHRGQAIGCRITGFVFALALANSGGHDGSLILFTGVSIAWLTVTACMLQVVRHLKQFETSNIAGHVS